MPRIGITLGDCAGIGPEIVEHALMSVRVARATDYQIIGKYPACTPGQPTAVTARAAAAAKVVDRQAQPGMALGDPAELCQRARRQRCDRNPGFLGFRP